MATAVVMFQLEKSNSLNVCLFCCINLICETLTFCEKRLLLLGDCNYPCVGKEYILNMEIGKNSPANKKKNYLAPFRNVELIYLGFLVAAG